MWAPGKQMRVLSQESSQQLLADALEKQFSPFLARFFFPSLLLCISKGRTLSWSEDNCEEWGRAEKKTQTQFLSKDNL